MLFKTIPSLFLALHKELPESKKCYVVCLCAPSLQPNAWHRLEAGC